MADTGNQHIATIIQPTCGPAPKDPESAHNDVTKEILDVLSTVRELKSKFVGCKTILDKVMLVLTHLGHCV